MADVKKIATRESYSKALIELGNNTSNVVVMDADLQHDPKLLPGWRYQNWCV